MKLIHVLVYFLYPVISSATESTKWVDPHDMGIGKPTHELKAEKPKATITTANSNDDITQLFLKRHVQRVVDVLKVNTPDGDARAVLDVWLKASQIADLKTFHLARHCQ